MANHTLHKVLHLSSLAIISITVALFILSVFLKGFTHELLLEVAVFLVSVKLILLGYKNEKAAQRLEERLNQIQQALEHTGKAPQSHFQEKLDAPE